MSKLLYFREFNKQFHFSMFLVTLKLIILIMFSLFSFFVFSIILLEINTSPVVSDNLLGDHEIISNSEGELQFSVSRYNLLVPNLMNNQYGSLFMNISLLGDGARIDQVTPSKLKKDTWEMKLADGSHIYVTSKRSTSGSINNKNTNIQEYYFVWSKPQPNGAPEMCFDLGNASWYSTFQYGSKGGQSWPMNITEKVDYFPLNTISESPGSSSRHLIVEHLLFSSTGYALVFNRQSPLWLSLVPDTSSKNQPKLCIKTEAKKPYSANKMNKTDDNNYIRFSLYTGKHLRSVYDAFSGSTHGGTYQIIPKPKVLPDEQLLVNPSWLVLAGRSKYFASADDLDQAKVIEFSDNLNKEGYRYSTIILESWWQWDFAEPYRYATFRQHNISTPSYMAQKLHENFHKLSLVVQPYLSVNYYDYQEHEDYFVKEKGPGGKNSPFVVQQDGLLKNKTLFDMTNEKAVAFMTEALKKVAAENNIDYFELAAIQAFPTSGNVYLNRSEEVQGRTSTLFSERYLTHVTADLSGQVDSKSHRFGSVAIVQEGHQTQTLPAFVRLSPRTSDWSSESGIKSLIPAVLALSIAGYSFVLPDIVGGRVVAKDDHPGSLPEEELFVRWTQAVTYMSAMQFATPPWEYNRNVSELVQKYVGKHNDASKTMLALANKRRETGTPVLRPLWYNWPEDKLTYAVNDQFMLGDDLLVAPVLEKGASGRTVYLPRGQWQCENTGKTYMAPATVWVDAPFEVLPRFKLTL